MNFLVKENLNQDIFNPPNVAGWPGGKDWLVGQRLENRINILERLFGDYEAVFEEARYYSDDEAQEHWIELKARIEAEAAKLEMRLSAISVGSTNVTKR